MGGSLVARLIRHFFQSQELMFGTQHLILAFSLLLVGLAGCGEGGDRVDVEGVVTLDGQPMPGVHLTFDQPELSPNQNVGYIGKTDDAGRYSLRPMIGDGFGAPPGKYRVSLTTAVSDPSQPAQAPSSTKASTPFYPESPPPPPEKIPLAYRGGKLTFEVPPDGTEEANFDLKSK
jgi:hypothetical protein